MGKVLRGHGPETMVQVGKSIKRSGPRDNGENIPVHGFLARAKWSIWGWGGVAKIALGLYASLGDCLF